MTKKMKQTTALAILLCSLAALAAYQILGGALAAAGGMAAGVAYVTAALNLQLAAAKARGRVGSFQEDLTYFCAGCADVFRLSTEGAIFTPSQSDRAAAFLSSVGVFSAGVALILAIIAT